jgi:hypothetical protein
MLASHAMYGVPKQTHTTLASPMKALGTTITIPAGTPYPIPVQRQQCVRRESQHWNAQNVSNKVHKGTLKWRRGGGLEQTRVAQEGQRLQKEQGRQHGAVVC